MVKGELPPKHHEVQAMNFSIQLTAEERNTLLDYYRADPDPQLRLHAHIILLLAQGLSWAAIAAVLFCSSRTIARWKKRFQHDRIDGLFGRQRGAPARLARAWVAVVIGWVTTQTPRAFGFLRSRWCCEVLALLLWRVHRLDVSRETVRRHLHQADIVWRRPRPVLRRADPQRAAILEKLRQLLLHLPDDETAVFEDEVDINLNPKIGCMWMRRGQQMEVITPGDNQKKYLAGSLHWRTGVLFSTWGDKRDGKLFVAHLHELRRRLRRYKKIHVICDNAKFHHDCWEVWEFCYRYGDRVVLHFLPKYAPELNPIERVWWRLHEAITRNHQCRSLETLVDLVLAWLTNRRCFKVQDAVYLQAPPEDPAQAA
jgi:putative transposase